MNNNKTNGKKNSSSEKLPPPKYQRKWIHYIADKSNDCISVSVASWNILAQAYVRSSLFPYASHSNLSFKARFNTIISDLAEMRADFFCLQEVDKFPDLLGQLRKIGYEGIFKKRTRTKQDGCAIFWNTSKFQLVKQCEVSFNKLFKKYNRNEFYMTDNVGMIALFKYISNGNNTSTMTNGSEHSTNNNNTDSDVTSVEETTIDDTDTEDIITDYADIGPGNYLCVANTHLFWNPSHPDVKFEQMKMFLDAVVEFNENNHPVIICGDLNSKPDSAVYELLAQRRVRIFHPEFFIKPPSLSVGEDDVPLTATKELSSLHLESAYSNYLQANGTQRECGALEPPFTNYQEKFQGTLDYIFFQKDKFLLDSVLDLPPLESVNFEVALPNSHYPSDHLPIQCTLKIKAWAPNSL